MLTTQKNLGADINSEVPLQKSGSDSDILDTGRNNSTIDDDSLEGISEKNIGSYLHLLHPHYNSIFSSTIFRKTGC
jgi:hypothetical protein